MYSLFRFVLKGVVFDVTKPNVDVHQDVIALTQIRCKRLLDEMKQRMFVIVYTLSCLLVCFAVNRLATVPDLNTPNMKISKVWFYGENPLVRKKSNLLSLNELASKSYSKTIKYLICFFVYNRKTTIKIYFLNFTKRHSRKL